MLDKRSGSYNLNHPKTGSENPKRKFGLFKINSWLSQGLGWLGGQVADHAQSCIILSIVISLALGTGFLQATYRNDPEFLYVPTTRKSIEEQRILDEHFPSNYSGSFDISRQNKIGRFLRIIIQAPDGGTLLTSEIWKGILEIDQLVHKASIDWGGVNLNYSNICARWGDECNENHVLELGGKMSQIESGKLQINYPIMFDAQSYRTYTFPQYFGGVSLNGSYIKRVEALLLNYIIAVDSEDDNVRGMQWERQILRMLNEHEALGVWNNFQVFRFTWSSCADEQEAHFLSAVPYSILTVTLMGIFTMSSASMRDWVRGKPWLGYASINSAMLGSIAGFGFVAYLGVDLVGINTAIPFIMLGIGIDDSFVMLASWRRTSPKDCVHKRLSETYSDAAVSITITTLTDALSFYVGILSPIPCVQSFSAYAGTCTLAIYIITLFFYGGVMAISGKHEEENRHSFICCIKAQPKSLSKGNGRLFNLFCTGGQNPDDTNNPEDFSENLVMKFFRDDFSQWLLQKKIKYLIIILYFAYLLIAGWGLTKIEEGLKVERLYRYDSYASKYYEMEYRYFRIYPSRSQVLITSQIDYFDPIVQSKVLKLLAKLKSTEYTTEEYSEDWLNAFLQFKKNWEAWNEVNITSKEKLMELFTQDFLQDSPYAQDIILDANSTQILASRFIIQNFNLSSAMKEKDLLLTLRGIVEDFEKDSDGGVEANVYNTWSAFPDQFIIIRPLAIQLVVIASGIVMFISILLIQNLICSFWILFSIVSIQIGVIGFFSHWNVSLDIISIINLLMCIGFSVDFSAHISYTFISSKGTVEERISNALYSLGLPIIQSGISSLIGILSLMFIPSYIFLAFLKIIILVIFFAIFHSLFLLPILFSIFEKNTEISEKDMD